MKINREELLKRLESVLPGLSTREIIEQSSCFIFKDGRVITYNDEIACSQKSLLDIEGAVQAMPLISILHKLKEEIIDISVSKPDQEELLIRGKRKQAGIRMEADIQLPIESIEKPGKWKRLVGDFSEAISMVQQCAGKDVAQFVIMTHIHITPKWIEASDNYQASRYKIETGIEKPTLVRRDSLKHIISLDMSKFSETENWIHFKNTTGLILSCRRYMEDYPKLSKILKVEGKKVVLPKGLRDAIERAEIFSVEDAEDNQIIVHIQKGKIKIEGRGVSGWFTEIKKIKYIGRPLSFSVSPELLKELIQKTTICIISESCLKIEIGKFTYVAVLDKVKKEKDKKEDGIPF